MVMVRFTTEDGLNTFLLNQLRFQRHVQLRVFYNKKASASIGQGLIIYLTSGIPANQFIYANC